MSKKHLLSLILILINLGYFPTLYAKSEILTYKMPTSLIARLKSETEQRQRGECEQKNREFNSSQFYAFNDDKLLLLLGLPDYFCNASSFLPVTIDSHGNWNAGAVLESYPTFLLADRKQQLWLVSHWEIEGVFPLLHHSVDGANWQEINLPKQRQIDCCFEYLKQVCLSNSQIQVKFSGIDDVQIGYWQTTLNDSLSPSPHWQKTNAEKIIPPSQCETTVLTGGDWQRKISKNNLEISFQSTKQRFKVIVPRWLK